MKRMQYTIAVLTGGPSAERGISLNSARSLCDHLDSDEIRVQPYYFDQHLKIYRVSRAALYSNTPADFDFKLEQSAAALNRGECIAELKKADAVFPSIHGRFGEDGGIQKLLEENNIPFVGSGSAACGRAFDKFLANEFLRKRGFFTVSTERVPRGADVGFFKNYFRRVGSSKAVIKPARSGSSIGVSVVASPEEASRACEHLVRQHIDSRIVIQPEVKGREFTVIVLENPKNKPVALIPTEIEMHISGEIFDYRKKYLPTHHVRYHSPPRFSMAHISLIRRQAAELFTLLGMRDFARFDGWVLPGGKIWFSDFNPISGMEQNSFLFQQAALLGMSHRDLAQYLAGRVLARCGKLCKPRKNPSRTAARRINILFGGATSERQVSVMSGTNVWLKLKRASAVEAQPYLLDTTGAVWELPYHLALHHTVEEIQDDCRAARASAKKILPLRAAVVQELDLPDYLRSEECFLPRKMTLAQFIKKSSYVFIGLHGGMGEDGTLQKMLEGKSVAFNGSGSDASRLCMDKFQTSQALASLSPEGIFVSPQRMVALAEIVSLRAEEMRAFWRKLKTDVGAKSIMAKPHRDGCSSGCARLMSAQDLQRYAGYAARGARCIPAHTLTAQRTAIEMPTHTMRYLLCERFVETDAVSVAGKKLHWKIRSGWIEVTVGVFGCEGRMEAFSPSLTVAANEVLSLEEKFQGGTGVNITPPPAPYVWARAILAAKRRIARVANVLRLAGYARVDAFMHAQTGEVIIIEVNTLPALSPSTVLFHQALAQKPKMYPTQFLRKIIEIAQ